MSPDDATADTFESAEQTTAAKAESDCACLGRRRSRHCHKVLQQLQAICQPSSVKVTKIPPGKPLKIFQSKDTDFKSAIPSAEHYKKEQGEEKCTSGGDGEFDQYRCV